MPRIGVPSSRNSNTTSGIRGVASSVTVSGPPDNTMPRAPKSRMNIFRRIERVNLAVHARFTDAPRDQLGVLGPEVDDQKSLDMDIVRHGFRVN